MRRPAVGQWLSLAFRAGSLFWQSVLGNSFVSGDIVAPSAAEQLTAPLCRAAFTQVRTKRRAPVPLVLHEDDRGNDSRGGTRDIGDIYYINLARSTDRRATMENHMKELGVQTTRLEAVSFDATTLGNYSDHDKELLDQIFGSWACGSWAGERCDPGDKVCCWGFEDALNMTLHIQSSHPDAQDSHEVRATTFFGNLATHILALQHIRDEYSTTGDLRPVLLMEDDARLLADWREKVAFAMELLPEDWDLVRLYYHRPITEIPTECHHICKSGDNPGAFCVVKMSDHPRCAFWSNAALLINPAHAGKILEALESGHIRYAEDAWLHNRGFDYMSSDRGTWPVLSDWPRVLFSMFSLDHLIKVSAAAGKISAWIPSEYAAELDYGLDNESTYNGGEHQVEDKEDHLVHVVYTVDHNVFESTLRSMLTVSFYNEALKLTIHLLVPPADADAAEDLKRCFMQRLHSASYLRGGLPEVEILTLWEMPFQMEYPHDDLLRAASLASQARLYLPEYLKDVKRVIYLDADTIVLRDVSQLFGSHMDHALAATYDPNTFGRLFDWAVPRMADHVSVDTLMFNDGVMLLDLDRWRRENITARLAEVVNTVEGASKDEMLLLNLEYQGHRGGFDVLGPEWNTFIVANKSQRFCRRLDRSDCSEFNDAIVHFYTSPKPWQREDWAREAFFEQFRHHWMHGGAVDAGSAECAGFGL